MYKAVHVTMFHLRRRAEEAVIAIIISGRLNCFCRDLAFPMTLTSRRRVLRWTLRSFGLRSSASPSTPFSGSPFDEYSVVLVVCVLLSLLNGYSFVLDIEKRSFYLQITCFVPKRRFVLRSCFRHTYI